MKEMLPARVGRSNPVGEPRGQSAKFRNFRKGVGPDLLWDREYIPDVWERMKLSELAYGDLNLSTLVDLLETHFVAHNEIEGKKTSYDRTKAELKKVFSHP